LANTRKPDDKGQAMWHEIMGLIDPNRLRRTGS
jgi:hypothetical protein